MYNFWLAFLAISLIFLSHCRSFWSHTPRILASVTKLRGTPAMLNSAWGGVLVLKHTWRAWHLEGFGLSLLLLVHSLNSSRTTCIALGWGNERFSASAKSSTYFQHFTLSPRSWAASLMTTWKPMGPSLVPWGRAPLTENFILWDCLIVTNALGSVADKVTQPRDDRSADPQTDTFLNEDAVVNHIKRF